MTKENQQKEVSCPYCESKHIDGIHAGLGLLEGNVEL